MSYVTGSLLSIDTQKPLIRKTEPDQPTAVRAATFADLTEPATRHSLSGSTGDAAARLSESLVQPWGPWAFELDGRALDGESECLFGARR